MTLSLSAAEALGRVPSAFRGIAIEPETRMVGRSCACGEYVWADPANPAPGVAAHNATIDHMAWWELEQEAWGEE
jgi:hypothetical protein